MRIKALKHAQINGGKRFHEDMIYIQLELLWPDEYKSYEELVKIENIIDTIMNQKRSGKLYSVKTLNQLTLPGIS